MYRPHEAWLQFCVLSLVMETRVRLEGLLWKNFSILLYGLDFFRRMMGRGGILSVGSGAGQNDLG